MKLSDFTELLQAHPDKQFGLVLPGLNAVPASFHITEVGHVKETFGIYILDASAYFRRTFCFPRTLFPSRYEAVGRAKANTFGDGVSSI